jgi:uncharacterized protein
MGQGGALLLTDARGTAPRPFHLMAKPTGAVCNLDCEYCFYLAKEALYPGSDFRMADDLLERYVAGLLQAHAGLPEVVVAFQGGEPTLMGLDFFRRVLELERQYAEPGQEVLNTLQTNATLLDDAWGQFLADSGFLVGVSIDGPRDLHDAFRVDKGGKPTYDRVMAGLDVLKRHGVEWNALTVVNSRSAGRGLEVYRFLRDDLGAQFIQLIPIVERDGDGVSTRTVNPADYGQFLIDVFEEWIRHDVGDVFVQSFDTALAHWMGMPELGICVHQETCGRALALEHNGDVYSCDHFVEPAHLVGNLSDGRTLLQIVDAPEQVAFGTAKRDTLPEYCRSCDVRFACHGGCPKDRLITTPNGEPGLNWLCSGYQAFFRHIDAPMRVMTGLLETGRDADGVTAWYAKRHPEILESAAPPSGGAP